MTPLPDLLFNCLELGFCGGGRPGLVHESKWNFLCFGVLLAHLDHPLLDGLLYSLTLNCVLTLLWVIALTWLGLPITSPTGRCLRINEVLNSKTERERSYPLIEVRYCVNLYFIRMRAEDQSWLQTLQYFQAPNQNQ
jgi:hypothetical protein